MNCDCGNQCTNIRAKHNGLGVITKVIGKCKVCGKVDLTNRNWTYADFGVQPPLCFLNSKSLS
jgi:hypothetical protein